MPCLFIWKARARGDLLTSYDGKPFYYDAVGNITFDGYWNYTWTQGRQLFQMYDDNMSVIWSYTYDANGMRTSRYSNGGTEHTYVYNGSQLRMMTYGYNTLYFSYDAAGTPMTVNYNGTTYYYVTNLQGDVIAILNDVGTAMVQYTYDAWGNVLTTTGSMVPTLGLINPLRYRGYVYDRETGLYYLQSRYYNPQWGRFINADDVGYLGAGSNLTSYNLFVYCGNNPVMGFDPTGHWDWGIIADIFALVVSFSAAITVGTETAVSKFMQTGSKNSALSTGVLSALEIFGVINNTINAVYYEFSEGNSDITSDSYTERYVSRWDRLDYVKQQTKSEHYDLNAWRYNSEYSVHMYGWYITGWAHSKNYGIVSTFAASCSDASIALNVWDNRWYVNVATVIFGIAGI